MSDQAESSTKNEESLRSEVAAEAEETPRRGGAGGGRAATPRRRRADNSEGGERLLSPAKSFAETSPTLNFEELRELIALFASNGLTEFELERESFRVHLKKDLAGGQAAGGEMRHAPIQTPTIAPPAASSSSPVAAHSTASASTALAAEESADDQLLIITAPIVGTFYRSPSPTAEVFVKAGSRVEPDTVVCIIEAMKLMNEIQAETSGEVVKVYVENGQPVEYGQKLFGVKR